MKDWVKKRPVETVTYFGISYLKNQIQYKKIGEDSENRFTVQGLDSPWIVLRIVEIGPGVTSPGLCLLRRGRHIVQSSESLNAIFRRIEPLHRETDLT